MNRTLITHPQTSETLCKKEWAEKLGITRTTFNKRIKKHPLLVALTPGRLPSGRDIWTQEQDEYLCAVCRTPNLYKRWNQLAKFRGWKHRSLDALNGRISLLKREGLIDGRRHLDESEGWCTLKQLHECMGISEDPVKLWIKQGLKVTRNGECLRSPYKVHLKDFVTWACTYDGAALVGKAIEGNAIAATWLLVQIGNWMPEVKKKSIHLEVA